MIKCFFILFALSGCVDPFGKDAAERPGTIVQLGIGDVYEYEESGGAFGAPSIARWTVGPVREIIGPYLVPLAAVPVYRLPQGPDSGGWFLDAKRGESVAYVDPCLWSRASCSEPRMMVWGECPFGGPFAPFASMRMDSIGEEAVVVDPVRGSEWRYTVTALPEHRLEFVLAPESPMLDTCPLPIRAVVDHRSGVLLESEVVGGARRLVSVTRGGLPLDLVGGADVQPRFELRPLDAGLPPGASTLVAGDWKLGEAWAVAKRESAEVAEFLRRHPGAVVADASPSNGAMTFAGIESTTNEWRLEVQALNGDALVVTTRRTAGPLAPTYEVNAWTGKQQEPFEPVGPQAGLDAFEDAMAALVGSPPLQPSFELGKVNRADSSYRYLFPVGDRTSAQGTLYKEHVMLHADAGRLAQAMLTREHAAAFLTPTAPT